MHTCCPCLRKGQRGVCVTGVQQCELGGDGSAVSAMGPLSPALCLPLEFRGSLIGTRRSELNGPKVFLQLISIKSRVCDTIQTAPAQPQRWLRRVCVHRISSLQCTNLSVSKHSRAARRNEIVEPEGKTLSTLPRADKTDLTSSMIRTMKKNEDLLAQKMHKKERTKVSKNQVVSSNVDKEKLERAISLGERLEGKIHKAKQRAKMVQKTRKSNWDMINSTVLDGAEKAVDKIDVVEGEGDEMEEDIYEDEKPILASKNAFSLLEEVEC